MIPRSIDLTQIYPSANALYVISFFAAGFLLSRYWPMLPGVARVAYVLDYSYSLPPRARARLGGAMLLDLLEPPWTVQRPLAAQFDGEVAGGAVANSTLVIFRFGATMELGGWGDR